MQPLIITGVSRKKWSHINSSKDIHDRLATSLQAKDFVGRILRAWENTKLLAAIYQQINSKFPHAHKNSENKEATS
jgi:hypothetical protein